MTEATVGIFLGIEFLLGFFGAKYLYEGRRVLASSLWFGGVLLACLAGILL